MRTLLSVLFFIAMLSGCRAQPDPALSGAIRPAAGWHPVVYLVRPRGFTDIVANYGGQLIDSAALDADGQFAFANLARPAEPTLFIVTVQPAGSRFANRLIDSLPRAANYLPVVLGEGQPVRLLAEQAQLQSTVRLDGASPSNQALLRLAFLRRAAFDDAYGPGAPGGASHPDGTDLLTEAARRAAFQQPLIAFANTVAGLWPALVAARWVSPDGDYERVPEVLAAQCRRWGAAAAGHAAVADLCRLARADRLPVLLGDTLPNVPMPLLRGDTAALHTLLGSRLTLVDLWASWCAPCRRENREVLAPLWTRYRERGLQIVGYALDANRGAWEAAIRRDGAVWAQASHLQGDRSPLLEALRVTTIPANYLVDANGRVLAKNVHGEALERLIEQYLNE